MSFQVLRAPAAPATRARPPLPSAAARFAALVHYEVQSSLRRRKVLAMLAIAVALVAMQVVLPPLLAALEGIAVAARPEYVISIGRGFGADIFSTPLIVIFAIAVAMDVVPLEFENGSIATLLSKPVGRGTVFLAKWVGVMLVLALTYLVLFGLTLAGAWAFYGPQEHLELLPLLVLGSYAAIVVYAALVFALGAVSRSSLIAAVGGFGLVFAMVFATFALSAAGHAGVALALPGPGPQAQVVDSGVGVAEAMMAERTPASRGGGVDGIGLGTHTLGANLVYAARNPGKDAVFAKFTFQEPVSAEPGVRLEPTPPEVEESLRTPLDQAVLRSAAVGLAWVVGLLALAWWRFARAEVLG